MTLCDSGDSTILRTDFRQIMSCCRCNRSGMCVGCKCTKSNKPCTSCLPLRLGNCKNPAIPEASPEASDQSPQVQQHQGSVPDSGQTAEIFIANSMPLESQSRMAVEDNESESSGCFPESEAPNFGGQMYLEKSFVHELMMRMKKLSNGVAIFSCSPLVKRPRCLFRRLPTSYRHLPRRQARNVLPSKPAS